MKSIFIAGATSAIATACARRWAAPGTRFYLVARNEERLQAVARDLEARGASTHCEVMDLDDLPALERMLDRCCEALGSPDLSLLAHGTLPDQDQAARDPALAAKLFHTNASSPIALLTGLANRLEKAGRGTIAVISSVAGERGRPSNYPYGASKAAVTAFCDGLRARLFKRGVHLLVIKPGFVATPMTAGLDMPGPLVAEPGRVAADIDRAVKRQWNTLYTPWFWGPIMVIIRALPQWLFKRLSL